MIPLHGIVRLSKTLKEQDAAHLDAVRVAIARTRQLLKHSRPIDTFAGRKTQEPFPHENADTPLAKWMGRRESKPSR
jgi:hypothetical protein